MIDFVLGCFTLALFEKELSLQIRTSAFWLGLGSFELACFILDLSGLLLAWWTFPPDRNIGLLLAGLPIEEFILYGLIYVLAICSWESDGL